MFPVQTWLRNWARAVSPSRGSRTPFCRSWTSERKPGNPSSSWSSTSRLWRRRAASCQSSKVGLVGGGGGSCNSTQCQEPLLEREPDVCNAVKSSEATVLAS